MESNDKNICKFPVPDISDLPPDIKNEIIIIQEKMGFVPKFLQMEH